MKTEWDSQKNRKPGRHVDGRAKPTGVRFRKLDCSDTLRHNPKSALTGPGPVIHDFDCGQIGC